MRFSVRFFAAAIPAAGTTPARNPLARAPHRCLPHHFQTGFFLCVKRRPFPNPPFISSLYSLLAPEWTLQEADIFGSLEHRCLQKLTFSTPACSLFFLYTHCLLSARCLGESVICAGAQPAAPLTVRR